MKKILGLAMILALMTGCSTKATTTVCSYDLNGIEINTEFVSKKDKVQTQTVRTNLSFEALSVTKDDQAGIDALIASFNEASKLGEGVKGYSTSIEVTEIGLVTEEIFDYTGSNLKKLVEAKVLDIDGNYISLEKTLENANTQGFICTEK